MTDDHEEVDNYRLQLEQKLEMDPKDVNSLVLLGVLAFEYYHESDHALSLFKQAILLDPLNVDVKFWLSMCLFYDYLFYEEAEKFVKEALIINSNDPRCLSLMARIIRDNDGSAEEGIDYVKKAILHSPDWPMLRYQLAEFFLSLGDIEKAELEFEKMMEMKSLDPHIIKNEVDKYYETIVTGRTWDKKKKSSSHLLQRILEAKQKKIKKDYYESSS